jgi:hypothetical protein
MPSRLPTARLSHAALPTGPVVRRHSDCRISPWIMFCHRLF